MNDEQLLRYSRQIMLPYVDIAGQEKICNAHVLIVGMGGLGSPIAMYLASAGVGQLTLCDDDKVDLSNLQRQIVHQTASVGMAKTESAANTLATLNPEVRINQLNQRLDRESLASIIDSVDAVVDATDNFETRFLLNEVCVEHKKPLVSGAAIRMEGQVTVFLHNEQNSPCYRCLYRDEQEIEQRCSETGILSPVVGIIGAIEATETLKIITKVGNTLVGRLLILDAQTMDIRTIRLKPDPQCPICSHKN